MTELRACQYILPLLSLLLKRHFEIIRMAQVKVIHPDELWDAVDTMAWVNDTVQMRVDVLKCK